MRFSESMALELLGEPPTRRTYSSLFAPVLPQKTAKELWALNPRNGVHKDETTQSHSQGYIVFIHDGRIPSRMQYGIRRSRGDK
ncbi:hypothetical protein [uncultured Pseudodesulfovibrio sp.]|uniref:hypothetical protein n=1 Tax=uncultured Pseudodesulfovibrio sp. TaxID=2035858 RepID=UPI0037485938